MNKIDLEKNAVAHANSAQPAKGYAMERALPLAQVHVVAVATFQEQNVGIASLDLLGHLATLHVQVQVVQFALGMEPAGMMALPQTQLARQGLVTAYQVSQASTALPNRFRLIDLA